jgi:hypothetical protein
VSTGVSERMKVGYDIFRQLDDGSPIWVANVHMHAQALEKVAALRRSAPARFFVRNAETGAVITDSEPGTPGETEGVGNNRRYAAPPA